MLTVLCSTLADAAFLYNDVAQIRRKLRETLGTDLTLHVPGSSLWHTGNAVALDDGDYRYRRPWEWVWEVAFGRSSGAGERRRQHWQNFARDFIDNHWSK